MGYTRHHAIVVTSWNTEALTAAHAKAVEVFGGLVSPIITSRVNGITSFFVAPDGSQEGWDESTLGDRQRAWFVAWLRQQVYEDGSGPLDWAEVQYGDAEGDARVIQHDDDAQSPRNAAR